MKVPFLDVQAAFQELSQEVSAATQRVLESGWYIGGPEVEAFEREWATYCETAHAVGTGNGLDALVLALRACGIGAGDAVIVPSHTYVATWLAVSAVGATIQPVEPDPATFNIDPDRIEAAITSETRAIIPVHLYGQPTDLDPILSIARRYGLRVIEDAAQSHGARYRASRLGGHGDVACWSFYPGKNLGALGDGGAITTNDPDIADTVRRLGNYGSSQKYIHAERGVNSRLDPIQAAALRVKLKSLDIWNDRRKALATFYANALQDVGHLILPSVEQSSDPVWHLYVIRSNQRDGLQKRLEDAGIGTLIHYPVSPHMQEAYADLGFSPDDFPLAKELSETVLSLPMGPHVTEEEAKYITRIVCEGST